MKFKEIIFSAVESVAPRQKLVILESDPDFVFVIHPRFAIGFSRGRFEEGVEYVTESPSGRYAAVDLLRIIASFRNNHTQNAEGAKRVWAAYRNSEPDLAFQSFAAELLSFLTFGPLRMLAEPLPAWTDLVGFKSDRGGYYQICMPLLMNRARFYWSWHSASENNILL